MDLEDLRQMLTDTLGAPLPDVVRDATSATENANLLRYLNLAQHEMASRVGGVESEGTISLVDGTRLYPRPSGLLIEADVRYEHASDDARSLRRVFDRTLLPQDYRSYSGEPCKYYWEANQIGLYPVPGSGSDGKTLRVYGRFAPTDLSADSDEPGYPPSLHRCIALLAGALVLEAQARAEAQASDADIGADSVASTDRTLQYSFRAKELRALYEGELKSAQGPVIA